jgi:spoIIIJ-associated protein
MNQVEKSAKTVDEAIQLALEELGVNRDEVEVDILSEGKRGILGVGAEEARVRVKLVQAVPEETIPGAVKEDKIVSIIQDILQTMLSKMGLEASVVHQVESEIQEQEKTPSPIVFNIEGEELGILIGRRGQTLACLQYIVRLMTAHQVKAPVLLVIDVNGYKQQRYQSLRALASRVAEQVAASGRPFTLEPMPAYERRIVHLALVDHPDVTTESIGMGEARKVVIQPRAKPRKQKR